LRSATKTATTWFGVVAGIAGLEHGYFEFLQGYTRPYGLMIASIGPPCVPEEVWNACEPAMTVIPNYLLTGVLAVIISLIILVWSVAFIHRKHGGLILIMLSAALLLFGGGIFPPLIGMIGGWTGTKINKSITSAKPNGLLRLTAKIWPWSLVIFLAWVFGQFFVGYFFNTFLLKIMVYFMIFLLLILPLSVYSAYSYDVLNVHEGELNVII